MATQPKTMAPAKNKPVAQLPDADKPDEARALADLALQPGVNGAVVVSEYVKVLGELHLGSLVLSLNEGVAAVNAGDMSGAEAMLYTQAQALQSMFMHFSRRALKQEYQKNLESFLRMALKAQNQCRMTLETLAMLKNPPVVIAKQANINNGGQQQVNNGGTTPATTTCGGTIRAGASAHAAKPKSDQIELLESGSAAATLPGSAQNRTGRRRRAYDDSEKSRSLGPAAGVP